MYFRRANKASIEASIQTPFVTCILGPRRVGKTTFVEHYAEQHPDQNWVFLNMDEMRQRVRVRNNEQLDQMIMEGARQRPGEGPKLWVVIDEAQKCPELFDQVKILYDDHKGSDAIKFILTGSAVLSLHQLSAESLAGRIELHHLYEFTLWEAAHAKESQLPRVSLLDTIGNGESDPETIRRAIEDLAPFRPLLEEQLEEHLLWGGLPELLECSTDAEKISYLNNYIQTYLEKDVRAIETITDLNLYRHLMDVLAEQTGSVREDRRIIEALGCTRDTLKKYRGYLAATLFYQDIFPFIGRALQRIVKTPTGYLLNNGVISVLTGISQLEVLERSGLIGHRLENWFLSEINTWLARDPGRSEVYFWRLTSGSEVDFVISKKPAIIPVEVTYASTPNRKKVRTLARFLSQEPSIPWGFYLYRGLYNVDLQNRIIFLPAWAIS